MKRKTLKSISLLLAAAIFSSTVYFCRTNVSAEGIQPQGISDSTLKTELTSKLNPDAVSGRQLTNEYSVVESEPNNSTASADLITSCFTRDNAYVILGTITETNADSDIYKFTLPADGSIYFEGCWIGSYFGYGWEDDLYIGVVDSKGNIIETGKYYGLDTNDHGLQKLSLHLAAGTYYLLVKANPAYGDTYVGEPYGIYIEYAPSVNCVVSYSSQGGSSVGDGIVTPNTTTTSPVAPTREGYTFGGWYKEASCVTPWNFSTDKVTSNTTLYAKWTINTYTLTFNSEGGNAVDTLTATYNSSIAAPADPTRADGTFAGWYKESSCITPWNFTTDKVTANTTLYAKWNYNSIARISGIDRYSTSVSISQAGWSQANSVIIATGANYPDALAASALTKSKDAPILLAKKDAMDPSVVAELQRLGATNAILIGGTGVIGTGVEDQLKSMGVNFTRISGTNRYDTSAKVAEIMGTVNGIVVATGLNFPDALSIAPIAAIKGMPILLSPKTSLDSSVSAFLAGKTIPVSYAVGGSSVLDSSIATGLPNSTILNGTDRYSTNLSIINQFSADLNFDTVYVATGLNFPDALSGSALAAKNNAPIILTGKDTIPADTINLLKSKGVKNVVVLGGNGVISQNVLNAIADAIK